MLLCSSVPTLVSIVHMSFTYGVPAQPQAIWNAPSNLGGNMPKWKSSLYACLSPPKWLPSVTTSLIWLFDLPLTIQGLVLVPGGTLQVLLKRALEKEGHLWLYDTLVGTGFNIFIMARRVASRSRGIIGLGAVLAAVRVTFWVGGWWSWASSVAGHSPRCLSKLKHT